MGLPAFRRSRSQVRRARSHLAIEAPQLTKCPNCSKLTLPHRACAFCGFYKGRQVVAIKADILAKRETKRKKQEEKAKAKKK
ncbi:50S ribosomal protein L32 [Candidatus Falkowbacteria bacterium]|nr:50S ribosomal protein L32 [Candidatus Falkowbacteria bacterium]